VDPQRTRISASACDRHSGHPATRDSRSEPAPRDVRNADHKKMAEVPETKTEAPHVRSTPHPFGVTVLDQSLDWPGRRVADSCGLPAASTGRSGG